MKTQAGRTSSPPYATWSTEWLVNIKRYSELRGTRGAASLKKLLDRFYLKLRPDQRRTVLLILFVQGLALATFVVAALGLGIAGLLI